MIQSKKRKAQSVEHRSTKRRKSNDENQPIYSTRVISWQEQLRLPPRFHEERDVWPALRILEERGTGRKKEYLLEWEAHPETGEIFEPTWEPADNTGQQLKDEWKRVTTTSHTNPQRHTIAVSPSSSSEQIHVPRNSSHRRRLKNRRIIPDSSAETEEPVVHNSVSSRTPTLTESPGSVDTAASPIEISETQQPYNPTAVRITVPPAPVDKTDWESLRASQFSNYETTNSSSSFNNSIQLEDSQATQISPAFDTVDLRTASPPSTSASRSSLRSVLSRGRDRGVGVQRILDYQPSSISSTGFVQYPSTSAQQTQKSRNSHDSELLIISGIEPVDFSKPNINEEAPPRKNTASFTKRNSNPSLSSPLSTVDQFSQPWAFKSQISLNTLPLLNSDTVSDGRRPALTGRCARKTASNPASQESALSFENSHSSTLKYQGANQTGMAARGTRQSPRLQTAIPHSNGTSPRIAVRTGSFRARAGINPPEHSSPLAVTAELAESDDDESTEQNMQNSSFINNLATAQNSSNMASIPPTSIAPSAMHLDASDVSLLAPLSQESLGYDSALNTLPTPVQESIEEELMSSAEDGSLASKASSSQESLRNEKLVPQVDGLVMPTYPILGEDEYAIALPAEGKVQAIYNQTIRVKRKAILKFIKRRGSVNTAGTSAGKTIERNEMIELIGRLHDTTTHIDLGLPGIPTQYTIPAQEHAAYAEYAGSKFVFLGYLLEFFQRRRKTIVIMAKSGATQDLLEEYLFMRNVQVRRHERTYDHHPIRDTASASPRVELLSTRSNSIVELSENPCLIIAFDASFENLDPQVKSLRAKSSEPIPVLHLLVTNSSEHVERCLPPSMPSPIRLRLLVRATYQAHLNLGGSHTILTNPSDELDGRPMDLGDINRAVRKSPNRRLQNVAAVVANSMLSNDFAASWTLSSMPELALDELDESPSTGSTISATPGRSRARSQTPISKAASQIRTRSRTPTSRAGTPSARKRQLEIDTTNLVAKRQRMTPVNEFADVRENDTSVIREHELHRVIENLRVELANEKRAREIAEQDRTAALHKATEWETALAALQRRYEKRTKRSHEEKRLNKQLTSAIENNKARVERVTADNTNLRQQLLQQKKELEAARNDLNSAGGDIAELENARAEARTAMAKAALLEKSLDNTKRDFEFLRTQYQDASNRAAELGTQTASLEARVVDLTSKASEERRRLKELNHLESTKQHLAKISQLEMEKRSLQTMYKKLEDESKLVKRTRGVQTRGSSMAPGTPGQRSRQGSPATAGVAPPSGSRASVLRNER